MYYVYRTALIGGDLAWRGARLDPDGRRGRHRVGGVQFERQVSPAGRMTTRVRRPRGLLHAVAVYGVLILLTLFILLPIGWMLTAALKSDTDIIFTFPPEFFPTTSWHWETFADALFDDDEPYLRYVANTTFLVVVDMTFAVVSNSLIAYAFARLRFAVGTSSFAVVIATMLLPAPVLLIPQFLLFFQIGWYNTLPAADHPDARRQRVLHLPAPAVHADHPPRPRRGRAHGRGDTLDDLPADHPAAVRAGPSP